ncbi:SDR family NAD(P)-dependent oxidoreductase [Paenibacillus albiflavus]|uniref:SDR family NAD(P)-dependent oxidoreductase n=1 Tax=Paenibacillus albiflavus TaxID=2545760 RepID=A0A4R4E7Y4_9BACL|nr:SDR family NAD(P)-dependent oxidoreductase [Paenibacillus albiflavus]TCZ75247.1 SDR family NAD(P)-dependent oxidoreductase [Paenibacillus albiflavus]
MVSYRWLEKLLFPRTLINWNKLRSELDDKTILITGASSGIGEQVALMLADLNVHMILVARRGEKLLALKQAIEHKTAQVSVYPADLRNKEELEGLIAYIEQLSGGLDFIVSNAGISIRRSIHDSLDRFHDFTRTMAINYMAPVQLLLATIPLLGTSKGHIINVSTINVLLLPMSHWAAYQASKSAFDTWFRSTALELHTMGITTTSVYLPLVRTPMIEPTQAYRSMPAMNPYHAAQIICKSMYTRKRTYKPWWILFGQWGSLMFRWLWELWIPASLRKRRS